MLRYGMQFVDRGALFYEARHRQLRWSFWGEAAEFRDLKERLDLIEIHRRWADPIP
jgi:hypothetical protein